MIERHSIDLRPQQVETWGKLERFNVLVEHRRFGKTVLAICWLIDQVQNCKHPHSRGHYFAPFLKQARNIAWDYLRLLTSVLPGMDYNKSELVATFPGGQKIFLYGADNPDSFRGGYSDAVVLDEVAQMSPRIWGEVVRPALADRKGKAIFIGTPFGQQNLFYELFDKAGDLPNWYRELNTVLDTGIIDEDELEQLRREMSVEEFEQEMMCSWTAQVRGAYYGKELKAADEEGRITRVPYDSSLPVHTCFDLGMADSTAIWFIQTVAGEVRAIDYREYTGTGLPEIIKDLSTLGYNYGDSVAPHDIRVREMGTGVSRWDVANGLGWHFIIAKQLPIIDGIDATRNMIKRMWFDEEKCKYGLEALRMYRSEWSDGKRVFALRPLHDWTSHAADSLRYFAVGMRGGNHTSMGTELNYDLLDRAAI
jgi:phage terminase large subunit